MIAVDCNEQALALASEFGATHLINSKKGDIIRRVLEINKKGASKVLICVGDSKVIEHAINCTSIPGECF